jgi:hypothetical protein
LSRHHRRHHRRHKSSHSIIPETYTDTSYSDVENTSEDDNISSELEADESKNTLVNNDKDSYHHHDCDIDSINFRDNLRKFIGRPVTVFTGNCGENSHTFSGILLGVNKYFIRMVTKLDPAPDFSLANSYNHNTCDPYALDNPCDNSSDTDNLKSIVDIPINKISAFIHNSL